MTQIRVTGTAPQAGMLRPKSASESAPGIGTDVAVRSQPQPPVWAVSWFSKEPQPPDFSYSEAGP
eukprot:1199294-Rhodomonas_salina.2